MWPGLVATGAPSSAATSAQLSSHQAQEPCLVWARTLSTPTHLWHQQSPVSGHVRADANLCAQTCGPTGFRDRTATTILLQLVQVPEFTPKFASSSTSLTRRYRTRMPLLVTAAYRSSRPYCPAQRNNLGSRWTPSTLRKRMTAAPSGFPYGCTQPPGREL